MISAKSQIRKRFLIPTQLDFSSRNSIHKTFIDLPCKRRTSSDVFGHCFWQMQPRSSGKSRIRVCLSLTVYKLHLFSVTSHNIGISNCLKIYTFAKHYQAYLSHQEPSYFSALSPDLSESVTCLVCVRRRLRPQCKRLERELRWYFLAITGLVCECAAEYKKQFVQAQTPIL